jgi:catechol 2,3-dioxygenase-like lactoylglutathione lyase family enzyme
VNLKALDHVALWTSERDTLTSLLVDCCGMHDIERTESFTLVGGDARRGKLTLFDAAGRRDRGVLERVVLRVDDPEAARRRLAGAQVATGASNGMPTAELPSHLSLGLLPSEDGVTDLDHLVLRVPNAAATGAGLEELGLDRTAERLEVAGKELVLRDGGSEEGDSPLLNHIAFLVDRTDDVEREARSRGLEIADVVDAPNTRAVFVWGPNRIKLEYVEHKPGFSLA